MITVGWYLGQRMQINLPTEAEMVLVDNGMTDEDDGTVLGYGGRLIRIGRRLIHLTDGDHRAYTAATEDAAKVAIARHKQFREFVDNSNGKVES